MTKFGTLANRYWPTLVLFAFLLASWQAAVTFRNIREYLLPAPLSVWNALWHGDTAWWPHLWTTTFEIIGAFLMAAVMALGCERAQRITRPKSEPVTVQNRGFIGLPCEWLRLGC